MTFGDSMLFQMPEASENCAHVLLITDHVDTADLTDNIELITQQSLIIESCISGPMWIVWIGLTVVLQLDDAGCSKEGL